MSVVPPPLNLHGPRTVWLDANIVILVSNGDWSLESELLEMSGRGVELLLPPAANQEVLYGNLLRSKKQNVVTFEQRLSAQRVIARLGIKVDMSASTLPLSQRVDFTLQAHRPNQVELKGDDLILGQVLAGSKSRGISEPVFLTDNVGDFKSAPSLGVRLRTRQTIRPQFLEFHYSLPPIYRTPLTVPISVPTTNNPIGRALSNQAGIVALVGAFNENQVKWAWDYIESQVQKKLRSDYSEAIAQAYRRGEGVLVVVRARVPKYQEVPIPEFVAVRVQPGRSPDAALAMDANRCTVEIGVDQKKFIEVVNYRWLGNPPEIHDPFLDKLLEESPEFQNILKELKRQPEQKKASPPLEETKSSPSPRKDTLGSLNSGDQSSKSESDSGNTAPTIWIKRSMRW